MRVIAVALALLGGLLVVGVGLRCHWQQWRQAAEGQQADVDQPKAAGEKGHGLRAPAW